MKKYEIVKAGVNETERNDEFSW